MLSAQASGHNIDLLSTKALSPINKAHWCQHFILWPQTPPCNPSVTIPHAQPPPDGVFASVGWAKVAPGFWEHKGKCMQSWAERLAHCRQNNPLVCETAPAVTQSWGRAEQHQHGAWSQRAAAEEALHKRNPSSSAHVKAFVLSRSNKEPTKKQTNKTPSLQLTRKPC